MWLGERAGDRGAVALKVLTPAGRDLEDTVIRFRAEAMLLRTLGGRHGLVGCEAVCDDPPAMILEFAAAGSLRDRLQTGPLPIRLGLVLGLQICEALSWLHASGVTHRDVKPSNVLMMEDGAFRLADLGVAAHGTPPRGLPDGWIEEDVGTTGYAAPELLADATRASPQVDIYGLGAVLYEAVSGRLPHPMHDDEDDDAYRRRLAMPDEPVPLTEAAAGGPPLADPRFMPFARVVHRALAPDPAERYPAVRDMAGALAALA